MNARRWSHSPRCLLSPVPCLFFLLAPLGCPQSVDAADKTLPKITVQLDCKVMNSEFNGRPDKASASEAQFWKSMEELLPVFEREGTAPHPDDPYTFESVRSVLTDALRRLEP